MEERDLGFIAGAEILIVPRKLASGATRDGRDEGLTWGTGRFPHHDVYTPRSLGYLILLGALWCANLMDAFSTLHGIPVVTWEGEANPILRFLAHHGGVAAFLAYKVGVVTIVATAFWFFHRAISRAGERARSARAVRHLGGWRLTVEVATLGLTLLFLGAALNNLLLAGVP